MPTQAEIDAIDPAELMAGLKALNLGERKSPRIEVWLKKNMRRMG
jgi:hypothetical protein